jgi:hypothetical protein
MTITEALWYRDRSWYLPILLTIVDHCPMDSRDGKWMTRTLMGETHRHIKKIEGLHTASISDCRFQLPTTRVEVKRYKSGQVLLRVSKFNPTDEIVGQSERVSRLIRIMSIVPATPEAGTYELNLPTVYRSVFCRPESKTMSRDASNRIWPCSYRIWSTKWKRTARFERNGSWDGEHEHASEFPAHTRKHDWLT